MNIEIIIITSTLLILVGLFLIYKNTNKQSNQNHETKVQVALSTEFENTLENIKGFVEESKKKTDENWVMFKDFDSMMKNRQERGSFHQKEMEDILKDRLPSKFLSFQKGLPNGKIVDGLVHFEEEKLRFCIDTKSIF